MELRRSGIWAGLLVAFTLGVLTLSTRSAQTLAAVYMPCAALAAGLYTTGFFVFSATWSYFLLAGRAGRPEPLRSQAPFVYSMIVSVASIAGLLTPMNLGTDILRSLLGRKHLGVEIAATAAASLATRECKLHVTFLLALVITAAASSYAASLGNSFLVVLPGLAGLILFIFLLRSRAADYLARPLGLNPFLVEMRRRNSRIRWKMRSLFYLFFLLGFAAECASLSLCFRALHIAADARLILVGYGILYFLSRVPGVPLGLGLVETGGFGFFRFMGISSEQAGAIMVLWSLLRVIVPYTLAAAASILLLLSSRRSATVAGTEELAAVPPNPDD